jgi:hypothetical protein
MYDEYIDFPDGLSHQCRGITLSEVVGNLLFKVVLHEGEVLFQLLFVDLGVKIDSSAFRRRWGLAGFIIEILQRGGVGEKSETSIW